VPRTASAGGLFHPLPEKRPQLSQGATQTGANITRQGCFPFLRAVLGGTPASFALAGFFTLIFYAGCVHYGTEPAASAY
jgi:hypothetical protein